MDASILLKGGLLFDGRGGAGVVRDVLVQDGKIARIAERIEAPAGATVIDAAGKWVTPGFVDLHTHYDAEVEVMPGLTESVRHGVTSVVIGSCSLSLAVGNPTNLADMFCRVEAIPRSVVLPLLEEKMTWSTPATYFEHLDSLPLGPNVASFFGHSTMRMSAMGIARSLSKGIVPTPEEMATMQRLLAEALDAGYLGMSIQTLPWDKMDGEEFRSRPLPSVFARWSEYRALSRVLRARGLVLQGVPNVSTKINVFLFLALSTGFFRKKLKTTVISLMDIRADRLAVPLFGRIVRFFNWALRADFKLQALPEIFDLWADGIDLVVFEEFGAGTAALHLQDEVARGKLLGDPEYRARFRKQWTNKIMPRAFHRELGICKVLACPDEPALVGKTFGGIAKERGLDPVDAFLDLVVKHGNRLRWYTVMGNDRPDVLRGIVSHPDVQIGFSDAGAHLRNMAHYNFPLRLLRMVRDAENAGQPFMTVGRAVQRLTSEIADWLRLDTGTLAEGRRADIAVVDPAGLTSDLENVVEEEMAGFGLKRLVRRDHAVAAVLINGKVAFREGAFAADLGKTRYGRLLRAVR
jgi:N-acyl-D-aspartate/D-glutamate deacylase